MQSQTTGWGAGAIVLAAVVVILAGVKAAGAIIVPFLLSLFLAIIMMPLLKYLVDRRVPKALALLLIISGMIVLFSLVGILFGHALNDFTLHLPEYEAALRSRLSGTFAWLSDKGVQLPQKSIQEMLDPGAVFGYLTGALKSFGSMLTNGFVILLTTIFMMLEGMDFKAKVAYIYMKRSGGSEAHLTMILEKINHYMALKAVISLATGFSVYVMLRLFGLDYPALWGVIAFLLNFIPNIGSIIAG